MEMDGKEEIYTWLKEKNSERGGKFHSNNGDVLIDAAISGAGLVLQPTFIASEAISSGKLIIVLPEFEPDPLGLYVVYAHRKLLPNKVRCFIDFIEGYYGTPPYWDKAIINNKSHTTI